MLLTALNAYEKDEYPKPEFKKGQTVYDKNGEKLKVSSVQFQSLTRVHMYQFEGKGYACSALGMRKTLKSKPYTMKDIIQANRSLTSIADDMLKSFMKNGQGSLHGTHDITGTVHALEFFQPDNIFIQWLKDYAGDRMIIDVGCGGGHLVRELRDMCGAKVCGIEPFFNMEALQKYNMDRIMRNKDMIHIFNKKVEQCADLIFGKGSKVLLVFARPCHSSFVENALKMKDADTEALYITKPENIVNYIDLGSFDNRKKLIEHKGFSVENEVVYSVK